MPRKKKNTKGVLGAGTVGRGRGNPVCGECWEGVVGASG